MYVAVSMWSLHDEFVAKRLDIQGFAGYVSGLGLNCVEILDYFFKDEAETIDAVNTLRENKIDIAAYSIGNDFVTSSEEEFSRQVDYIIKSIDLASEIGTKNLRVFSGNPKEGIAYDQGMSRIIEGFRQCAPYAEKKGITMVLENHGAFAGKSSQVKDIIEKVGSQNLMANIDTGNFLLVKENPLQAAEYLNKYIGYIHFKDFKKLDSPNSFHSYTAVDGTLYQGTIIGQGDVDLPGIIEMLKISGYSGFLSIEYEGVGSVLEETAESIKYLKGII